MKYNRLMDLRKDNYQIQTTLDEQTLKYNNMFHGKLYDVVLIRSLAIILVVFFHSYEMMYAPVHFPDMTDVYRDMYYNVNSIILRFRMPLFVFISGYLFSYLEKSKGKYATFKSLIKNKFCRLIIPFFIFAIIYMLTTNSFDISSLISGDCAHLWFIAMLFWCFIITRILRFIPHNDSAIFKIIFSFICFVSLFYNGNFLPQFIGIQFVSHYYFWFYLGYVLSPYREQLYKCLYRSKLYIGLFAIWMLSIYLYYVNVDEVYPFLYSLCRIIGFIAIVILIWYVMNRIIHKYPGKWLEGKFFKELNRTSYGIYVLHFWLQGFMISSTAKRIFNLELLAVNHTILFPLSFFLLSLLLSYIGAVLILKTKVGRFLIG